MVWGGGVLAAGWIFLLWPTHYHWGPESYYNYGWAIPVLGLFLFYRRYAQAEFTEEGTRGGGGVGMMGWGLVLVMVAGLIGGSRLMGEVNPVWRIPLWVHGLALCAGLGAVVFQWSGWRGMKHFLFPLVFLLLALPWPYRFEQWVIHTLTGWVTQSTVLALNLSGYPAEALGNVIQIGEVRVGVDEACSGIRSLQTLVMVALFLGEYFRFGAVYRAALGAGALALVLIFNGIRAIALAWVTLEGDAEAFQFWHDALGHASFICSCGLLFGLGEVLSRRMKEEPDPVRLRRLPEVGVLVRAGVALASVFLVLELAVKSYYWYQEARKPPLPALEVKWPEGPGLTVELSEIPENITEILACDFGTRADLVWANGLEAAITHYGYTGEDRMASVTSFGHSPEICMTAAGARLVRQYEDLEVEVAGRAWPMKNYDFVFERGAQAQNVRVFWLVWEPQKMGIAGEIAGNVTWSNQWALVKSGRRNFARQVILIYFAGEIPDSLLQERVRRLVREMTGG